MRERNLNVEAAERLAVATRASLGVWRISARGEQRAVSRALEPTEQVHAVACGSYEIVRHGVEARRSMSALLVVTDRRLIFAIKLPLRPARVDEVTRPELRDATMEADASDRRVVVEADAIRIALRPWIGHDAVETIASGIRRLIEEAGGTLFARFPPDGIR